MLGSTRFRVSSYLGLCLALLLPSVGAHAASKAVDLDGNAANGAESQCDLNVLQTFPVMIENKVTNKSGGNAFAFSWPSAGPGGFTSSVTAGTTGGVGAKWVWTTNQSVFSYTGNNCDNDVCFTQTSGPDSIPSYCSSACLADATSVTITKGTTAGTVVLNWTGGQGTFTIYRSTSKIGVAVPANVVGTTDALTFTDTPPATDSAAFYVVRGTTCTTRKACGSNADCSAPGDGTCVGRGPFGVPGRSLLSNNVTVSAASLTSSLITFFSPPTEVFRATSTAGAGGVAETVTNSGTSPVTVTTPAYPPGCCPADPNVPHQLRCGETCVDYLNDPANCGACGNTCGDGTCCSNGSCVSLCAVGDLWCDGQCADIQDDNNNCGGCGVICGDGTCCNNGSCESLCGESRVWCDNLCVDFRNDSGSCGTCGTPCADGTCCDGGACVSVCPEGQVWCGTACVDFWNDSANCGACGNTCGDGTCCNNGVCESFCPEGQVLCGNQCVDLNNDSTSCGACGNTCGEGSCCNNGACESFCPEGQVLCGTQCVDFNNDNGNCGACGNTCGDGTCCNEGACASVCPAGQVWCNNQCVDLQNDSANCGACGTSCGAGTCCNAGACVGLCPAGYTLCDGQCVNLQRDPKNCGTCGHVCGHSGGSSSDHDSDNKCRNGHCEHDLNYSSLDDPPPIPPVCPNPNPSHPGPGQCPNSTPTVPTPGYCHNTTPTTPTPGYCHNESPTNPTPGYCHNTTPSDPIPGSCPNPTPSSPVPGYCQNTHPSPGPSAGVCPESGAPAPIENEAAICTIPETTTTIPPGGSSTTCSGGGVLFKEVPTEITVCGDGIPGVNGLCGNTATKVTTGTFNRLVPDETTAVGNAYVTPYSVHVVADTSNDGLIEPGETVSLVIEALNAGPMNITNATATLSAQAIDLTDDGVVNPVGLTVNAASVSYGTIFGTPPASNCVRPPLQPAQNVTVFQVTVPANHPGDTSHPMILTVNGTVNGGPFTMSVPIVIGIADKCDIAAHNRDFDGLVGLSNPMAKLVPQGDTVPFPSRSFNAGGVRSMKLSQKCGSAYLTSADVDAPQIVALTEATRGAINVATLKENHSGTFSPFFIWEADDNHWEYDLVTSNLGAGRYTITIRIAGRKNYVTGFVLQ